MPQAYFTFAKQIFHIEDISLVPKERISLKKAFATANAFFMVRATGLEPVRYFYRGILSPLRLPVPPHPHILFAAGRGPDDVYYYNGWQKKCQAIF